MARTTERTVALSEMNLRGTYTVTSDTTVYPSDSGIIFVANESADIEFTLPAVADYKGKMNIFINRADYEMLITGGTADVMVLLNNATADGVSITTASEHIGGAIMVVGDGSYYYVFNLSAGANTVTAVSA